MPKEWNWSKRDRESKLANILFPLHATEEVRKEMSSLATNEGKKAPGQQPLLADAQRGSC